MRCAWIAFHKNAGSYPQKWIEDYVNSYHWQTVKIQVYEINYGTTDERLFTDSVFVRKQFNTHAEAHNYILDMVFEHGYDYAFNSNIDDIYDKMRVELQMQYLPGNDVISCNHSEINGDNEITRADIPFSGMSVGQQFQRNHNIISHPGVVYSANFWRKCPKLDPVMIPRDDMMLWIWGYEHGYKFKIVPHTLVYHRIHSGSVAAPRRKQKA